MRSNVIYAAESAHLTTSTSAQIFGSRIFESLHLVIKKIERR